MPEEGIDENLKDINTDIIFFFLLLISAFISFYIIIDKKKNYLNLDSLDSNDVNLLFRSNRILLIFIDIYFTIDAYDSLKRLMIDENRNDERIREQSILLVSNILVLISALLYIPLLNSDFITNR